MRVASVAITQRSEKAAGRIASLPCVVHRGWTLATTYNFIATIIQKFGCATTPIRIRRGAQTECASVVSPTQHVMSRKENRHAKT